MDGVSGRSKLSKDGLRLWTKGQETLEENFKNAVNKYYDNKCSIADSDESNASQMQFDDGEQVSLEASLLLSLTFSRASMTTVPVLPQLQNFLHQL